MLGKYLIQAAANAFAAAPGLEATDVFAPAIYTGSSSAQSINNGINLATYGGMVWGKNRTSGSFDYFMSDSARGIGVNSVYKYLRPNSEGSELDVAGRGFTSFNSNGFTVATDTGSFNNASYNYVTWTFRKAAKFFDVVTYTGTGSAQNISHSLGSVPGCIIVKRMDSTGNWRMYHRANTANPETDYLSLNLAAATADSDTYWNDTAPTSSVFTVGTNAEVNVSGGLYVAYLFAHDAGGFGPTATESPIICGGYTGTGSAIQIDCGFDAAARFVMIKQSSGTNYWTVWDSARGINVGDEPSLRLGAILTDATTNYIDPVSNGFQVNASQALVNTSGQSYVYIAVA
jgi:hypothetical protein